MQLQQLYENFALAPPNRQQEMIAIYRLRRAEDMAKPSTYKKKKPSAAKAKPELTEQEKLMAQLLGMSKKDMLALRESMSQSTETEEEVADDSADLFKDSTFEGGEEE